VAFPGVDQIGPEALGQCSFEWPANGTPHTEALHVVERYRLLDYAAAKEGLDRDAKQHDPVLGIRDPNAGKYLQLQFTVDDDGVFTAPWSATMTYVRDLDGWMEDVGVT
jgi:hypothetical protein